MGNVDSTFKPILTIKPILAKCGHNHYFVCNQERIERLGLAQLKYDRNCPDCIRLGYSTSDWIIDYVDLRKNTSASINCKTFSVNLFTGHIPHDSMKYIKSFSNNSIIQLINSYGFVLNESRKGYEIAFQNDNEFCFFIPNSKNKTIKMIIVSDNTKLLKDMAGLLSNIRKQQSNITKKPKIINTFSDFIGKELHVGQYVGFVAYGYLRYGKILKFSNKTVQIEHCNPNNQCIKYNITSSQIVVLDENQLMIHKLSLG